MRPPRRLAEGITSRTTSFQSDRAHDACPGNVCSSLNGQAAMGRGCVQTPFERPRPAELNALANVRDDEEEGLVPYVLIAAISRCVPRTCIARFRL
jgi:hypothetical protein